MNVRIPANIPDCNEVTEASKPMNTTINFFKRWAFLELRIPFPTFQEEESPGSPEQWIFRDLLFS